MEFLNDFYKIFNTSYNISDIFRGSFTTFT